tara:strand:- start:125 stop:424 length:300 start_codon:yes stop_codon:yes gene_type:complete
LLARRSFEAARLASRGLSGKLSCPMTKQDEVRRKNLRRLLKDGAGKLTVAAEDLRWLLDETSRLQQSNDRLRGQNRRMRIKAGGDGEALPDEAPDEAID